MQVSGASEANVNELRAERDLLLRVVNRSSEMLVRCDLDYRFTFVNEAYAARFGLKPVDVIGRKVANVVGERAIATFRHYMERAYAGESQRFELTIPYDDLGERY